MTKGKKPSELTASRVDWVMGLLREMSQIELRDLWRRLEKEYSVVAAALALPAPSSVTSAAASVPLPTVIRGPISTFHSLFLDGVTAEKDQPSVAWEINRLFGTDMSEASRIVDRAMGNDLYGTPTRPTSQRIHTFISARDAEDARFKLSKVGAITRVVAD